MFTKSALLAFVTLATLATATLMQPRQARGPIALPKQSSFTKSDGTFDYDKAVAQTVATKNKHRQTLINLQNNTGSLPQGFETKALASLPSSVEASLKKRQAEALTDEEDDEEWTGTISIGSTGQSFLVDLFGNLFSVPSVLAGSSDLWVPSLSCTSSTCSAKARKTPAHLQPLPRNPALSPSSTVTALPFLVMSTKTPLPSPVSKSTSLQTENFSCHHPIRQFRFKSYRRYTRLSFSRNLQLVEILFPPGLSFDQNFHDLQIICPSSILPAEMKTEAPGRLSKLSSPVMSFMNHILRRPRYLDPSTPACRSPQYTTSNNLILTTFLFVLGRLMQEINLRSWCES
ncbi:hypothetical protein F5877DRAFT_84029 [Lentinula edodes]|nr:hypothetical protein F5877DRAFT_84029 [Lentinula edodes]